MNPEVGLVRIEREFINHDASFETAAWWRNSEVQPGEYVAFYDKTSTGWVRWTYNAVITDEYFPSLYGGVPISGNTNARHIGEETEVHCSPYAYSVAHALLENDGKSFDIRAHYGDENGLWVGTFYLNEGWEAIEVNGSYEFDGGVRNYTTHQLIEIASA